MRLKRKDLIIITVLVSMCLVTLVGSSYALFTKTLSSTKKISVQAGTLKVDFAEGNRINLSNVAPMSDSDGMNTTPYTFTITNSGSVAAYYTIRNEEDSSNTLNNKYIKYRLISDSFDSGIKTLDTIGSGYYILSSENTVAVGKSITYKLYLWLSSEADNDAQNKTYQSKIVVQSTTNSISETVATALLKEVGENGSIDASDPEQTFITGTDPNNYIWYSGKLWRAVSIDPSDNSVKLVTQWNILTIQFDTGVDFSNSYVKGWLNNTDSTGFLGSLREPDKFIKSDSVWNFTTISNISKPAKTNLVTSKVGLLNVYEYSKNYILNNGIYSWIMTPYDSNTIWASSGGGLYNDYPSGASGIRPAINLKGYIKVMSGTGSISNPYRLEGDYDGYLSGTLLSTRFNGEYVKFGSGENNLYRIVSHEDGYGTKITTDVPLKENGKYKLTKFDESKTTYSIDTSLGKFLNGEFLNTNFTPEQLSMIENSKWFIEKFNLNNGDVFSAQNVITSKVGLLRMGELMSGQFDFYANNAPYWLLTKVNDDVIWRISEYGGTYSAEEPSGTYGIKPAMNLKSNVMITGGDGTKSNPFTVALQ